MSLRSLRVSDVMRHGEVITISPEATVEELNRLLAGHGITGVPVVDREGKVVGVVSQSDVVKLISRDVTTPPGFYHVPLTPLEKTASLGRDVCGKKVSDIMERRVHSVTTEDDVATAARILRNLRIHRLIVLRAGRLAGIVTALDLLKILERPAEYAEFYTSARLSV
jgi:CBS domain-containing protein